MVEYDNTQNYKYTKIFQFYNDRTTLSLKMRWNTWYRQAYIQLNPKINGENRFSYDRKDTFSYVLNSNTIFAIMNGIELLERKKSQNETAYISMKSEFRQGGGKILQIGYNHTDNARADITHLGKNFYLLIMNYDRNGNVTSMMDYEFDKRKSADKNLKIFSATNNFEVPQSIFISGEFQLFKKFLRNAYELFPFLTVQPFDTTNTANTNNNIPNTQPTNNYNRRQPQYPNNNYRYNNNYRRNQPMQSIAPSAPPTPAPTPVYNTTPPQPINNPTRQPSSQPSTPQIQDVNSIDELERELNSLPDDLSNLLVDQ